MTEFAEFLKALYKNLVTILLGGIVALSLNLWQWFGSPISKGWYTAVILFSLIVATYRSWRDEFRRANTATSSLIDLQRTTRQEEQQRATAIWKPNAELRVQRLENELRNELILKDTQEFELRGVALLSPVGVKLADVRSDEGVRSTGFRVHIQHSDILKLWNRGVHAGSVQFSVGRGNDHFMGSIPFIAEATMIKNTQWIQLVG